MKIGLSTATFFGKILTEDALDYIKLLNIDIAEVFLTTFSEYEKEFTLQLSQRLNGVEVYSIHSLNNHYEPELFNRVDRTRHDGEKLFDKVIYGGNVLGASYYTFHGPSRLKVTEYNLDYKRIGARVEELCKRAAEYNIKISYENVSWAFYNSPGFFRKIKNYAPSLYGTLDIKQAMQAYRHLNSLSSNVALTERDKIDLENYTFQYIDDMSNSLSNVHLSDYDEYGKLCAPGQGIFNYDNLIDKLDKSAYKGPLMIELYSRDYESFNEIKDSIEYLKDIVNGGNYEQ